MPEAKYNINHNVLQRTVMTAPRLQKLGVWSVLLRNYFSVKNY